MKSILSVVFVVAIPAFASGADFAGSWKVTFSGAASAAPKTIRSMIFDFKINGGEIELRNDTGRGLTVTIRLPHGDRRARMLGWEEGET